MGRYFEKKSGVVWLILTLLLFYYIFGAILKQLLEAFLIVIAIGIIIWAATSRRKPTHSRETEK